MTNDEIIRQVATEIRQHHHRGTMEEALDAAKAITQQSEARLISYQVFADWRGLVISMLTSWPEDKAITIEQVLQAVARLPILYQSYLDGEDYQLLSTAPQVVEEIIEPQGWTAEDYGKVVKEYAEEQRNANAPTTETQEGTGTPAGQ